MRCVPSSSIRHCRTAALLALLGALLAWPASAAACSKPVSLDPAFRPPNHALAPLAIGDSTMILGAPELAKRGFRVDAKGCRSFLEGLAVVRKFKRRGRLPHLVLFALGANHHVDGRHLRAARRLLGPDRVMALVTPVELGGWAGPDAQAERKYAANHPDNVVLIDWVRRSRGRSAWFSPDKLHQSDLGAVRFAAFLASKAMPVSQPSPPPPPPPPPPSTTPPAAPTPPPAPAP